MFIIFVILNLDTHKLFLVNYLNFVDLYAYNNSNEYEYIKYFLKVLYIFMQKMYMYKIDIFKL